MPPRQYEGNDVVSAVHRWVYPPESKFYWYRQGKVKRSGLSVKYVRFMALSLLVALAGSGGMMFGIMLVLSATMQEYWNWKHNVRSALLPALVQDDGSLNVSSLLASEAYDNVAATAERTLHGDVSVQYIDELCKDPVWIGTWMCIAGTFTLIVYYLGASAIHNEYYIRRRHEAKDWKCQPTKFPSDALFREEQLTGCWNAFVSGALGSGLFFLHVNYDLFKFYYRTEERGFLHFVLGCVFVYLWVDFYSYWMHRLLHHKAIYKHVHKWHHRYKQPTPFAAFAIHPIEYVGFQTAGIWCAAFAPVHVLSFLLVVTFIAYHNQIDHSGVYYEGDLPWVPSAKFHDE